MPLPFGRIYFVKSIKERNCSLCEEPIELRSIYIKRVGKIGTRWTTQKYHINCAHISIDLMLAKWAESNYDRRTIHKHKQYRLGNMSEETKLRRRQLLMYLNTRGRNGLIKAYKQKSTHRLFKVMANINLWLVELESMGIEFPRTFINKESICKDLIELYDKNWLNKLQWEDNNTTKWAMFIRSRDEGPQPNWYADGFYTPPIAEKEKLALVGEKVKL